MRARPAAEGSSAEEPTPATRARDTLVDKLRSAGTIRREPVEAALRAVPRHLFLPAVSVEKAYADDAIVTRNGPDGSPTSSASQPAIVAIMLDQLEVEPGQRVLEIGAGTGYNAALLAHLTRPDGRVTTIDVDPDTAADARRHLDSAGVRDVEVLAADGWLGHPAGAPYDRIEATAGIWDVPVAWVDQLAEGGVLVAPLWLGPGLQASVAFVKSGRQLHSRTVVPCGFMRLRGAGAGPESYRSVGDWRVAAERLDPAAAAVLAELLVTPGVSQAAPPVRRGWSVQVALRGDRAVLLTDERRSRVAAGLFDPDAGSLVLAEGAGSWLGHWVPETVRWHGGDALLPELLTLLQEPEDLQVERLKLVGVRRGDPLPDPGGASTWVLERLHHRFQVQARARLLEQGPA